MPQDRNAPITANSLNRISTLAVFSKTKPPFHMNASLKFPEKRVKQILISYLRIQQHNHNRLDAKALSIGHVRYINILAWLRGFRVKIANFLSFFCLSIPKRDLDTKKTTPNIEFWPESLGAMLEYWYIERGLLINVDSRARANCWHRSR